MNKIIQAITQRGPLGWFRRLFFIVRTYGHDIQSIFNHMEGLGKEVSQGVHFIKRATKIHADVTLDAKSGMLSTTIILLGRYRGKDHIQTVRLPPGDMPKLIEQLKHMSRAAQIEYIDAPAGLDVTIKRELDAKVKS